MPSPRQRIGFLDAARTVAMLLMVNGHVCDNLLSAAGRQAAFYQAYLPVRGLTGPLFFFVSGFALVMASDSHWLEYGRPGRRLWGKLKRAGALLLVGWLLQVPRWSGPAYTQAEWTYLFRVGVLHSIAVGLLASLALLALTRSKRAFTVAAFALAVGLVAVAPLASRSQHLPHVAGLLLRTQEGSLFPHAPWCAHFLLGAVVARLHLDQPSLRPVARLALLVGTWGLALRLWGTAWLSLRPADVNSLAAWVSQPAVFFMRAGLAWCVFAGLALLLGGTASRPWLTAVASRALSVFVIHLVFLYGVPGFGGLVQRVGPSLPLWGAFLVGPSLFAACAVVAVGGAALWGRGRRLACAALRRLRGRGAAAAEPQASPAAGPQGQA